MSLWLQGTLHTWIGFVRQVEARNRKYTPWPCNKQTNKQRNLHHCLDLFLSGTARKELSVTKVKFKYSEKATKFCEISTLLLSYEVPVKNFVPFSEYTGSSYLMRFSLLRISLMRFFKTISKIWLMRFYGLLILLLPT